MPVPDDGDCFYSSVSTAVRAGAHFGAAPTAAPSADEATVMSVCERPLVAARAALERRSVYTLQHLHYALHHLHDALHHLHYALHHLHYALQHLH